MTEPPETVLPHCQFVSCPDPNARPPLIVRTQGWSSAVREDVWGRRCPRCDQERAVEPFGTGYRLAFHASCSACCDINGQRVRLAEPTALTRATVRRLPRGTRDLTGLDWWHSSDHEPLTFDPSLVEHIGDRPSAEHRIVSKEVGIDNVPVWPATSGSSWRRFLYQVELNASVRVRDEIVVENLGWDARQWMRQLSVTLEPDEVQPYLNVREAPGTISLLIGRGAIRRVKLETIIEAHHVRSTCDRYWVAEVTSIESAAGP